MNPNGQLFRIRADRVVPDTEQCLVLLPQSFIDVLLDGSYRLGWDSTWIDSNGYRVALDEGQKSLIELGLARMVDCVNIIINNECGSSSSCCSNNISVDTGGCVHVTGDDPTNADDITNLPVDIQTPLDPTGAVPSTLIDAGIDTWPLFDIYMCDVSHHLVKLVIRTLRSIETLSDRMTTVSGVLTVMAVIFPPSWLASIGAITVMDVVGMLIDLFVFEEAFDALSDLADEMEIPLNYDTLVCKLFDNRHILANSKSNFVTEVRVISNAIANLSTGAKDALENAIDTLVPVVALYSQFLRDAVVIQTGNDCTSCMTAPAGGEFPWTFDIDIQTWHTNAINANTAGAFWQTDGASGGEMKLVPRSTGLPELWSTYQFTLQPVFGTPVTSMTITKIVFDAKFVNAGSTSELFMRVYELGGTSTNYPITRASNGLSFTTHTYIVSANVDLGNDAKAVEFTTDYAGNGVNDPWIIDNVVITATVDAGA